MCANQNTNFLAAAQQHHDAAEYVVYAVDGALVYEEQDDIVIDLEGIFSI